MIFMKTLRDLKVSDAMAKRLEYVKPDARISEILGSEHIYSLPVMESKDVNSFLGILDYNKLMESNLDINAEAKTFVVMPPVFEKEEPLLNILPFILQSKFRAVPIKSWGKIIGIVSTKDMARILATQSDFSNVKAKDIMTKDVLTVSEDDGMGKALSIMRKKKVTRLPVIKEGKVTGIITFYDVMTIFFKPRKRERLGELKGTKEKTSDFPVRGIMQSPVVSVSSEDNVKEIIRTIDKFGLSEVLVIDEGRLRGIISTYDIVKLAMPLIEETKIDFTVSGEKIEWPESDHINKEIQNLLKKNIGNIEPLSFHVKKHEKEGGLSTKYSVNAMVSTNFGIFNAKGIAWDLVMAFSDCINNLERIIEEKKEKERKRHRHTRG